MTETVDHDLHHARTSLSTFLAHAKFYGAADHALVIKRLLDRTEDDAVLRLRQERLKGIGEVIAAVDEDPATLPDRQMLVLADETGEAIHTYRRWRGRNPRHVATKADTAEELADVLITLHTTAAVLGIDLDAAVDRKLGIVENRLSAGTQTTT